MATGCDMLIVQAPLTKADCKLFGKNADLPRDDVQWLAKGEAADYKEGVDLKCTFINIPQVSHTYAWVASQPNWSWGIEMGANEHNVVIGSVALGSKLRNLNDRTERLLDLDCNRLALERSKSASEAVDVITKLIERFGQGGMMSPNDVKGDSYDSAYIILDRTQVWLLETTEFYWAARRIQEPWFNISNHMTITTNYDRICDKIENVCVQKGLWDKNEGKFNWAKAVGLINKDWVTEERKKNGELIMEKMLNEKEQGAITISDVAAFFRDCGTFVAKGGICRRLDAEVVSVSTMLNIICPFPDIPPLHLFTLTPDPSVSFLKPLILGPNTDFALDLVGEQCADESKQHRLYKLHNIHNGDKVKQDQLRQLESQYINKYMNCVMNESKPLPIEAQQWFRQATEKEIDIFKNNN